MDSDEQIQQQELLITQLKDLLRENENRFQEKAKECDELSSKFQKFKLQSKAKISHLTSQIKEQEKLPKKDDGDFDDTSSSDSTEQSQRGKVILLKKQLEQMKQKLEKKEEETKKAITLYERKISDLDMQLNEKNILILSLAGQDSNPASAEPAPDQSPKKDSNVQEMYAQIVYKDSKIMDLNNQILELEKRIMDLQEHVKEKDEVLQQRNKAVQLMAEDMSRKGKSVVDELDETREQMKIMQENFSSVETDWKVELEKYKLRVGELEAEIGECNSKLKASEASAKNSENAKYELSAKNTELQKKIVCVQESAAKQCELYNKEIGGEVDVLRKQLESEKQHSAELQKALDESSSQSDNKVLKARVKERTKLKALERELNELKKANEEKTPETLQLQQHIAELEEEKGSLQLKIMDLEEQLTPTEPLKEEIEMLKKSAGEHLAEVKKFEEQMSRLEIERENWKTESETFRERHKKVKDKFDTLWEENRELKEKYLALTELSERMERHYDSLKEENNSLQQSLDERTVDVENLLDEKIRHEFKIIEFEEMRESDRQYKQELTERIAQLEDALDDESKPQMQLEKENLALKDKFRNMEEKCTEHEKTVKNLTDQVVELQKQLKESENTHSLRNNELLDKINALEANQQENEQIIKSKKLECEGKENSLKTLQSNFESMQIEISEFLVTFNVKSLNDCKNYMIKRQDELSKLKNEYEKLIHEQNNLIICLQEKERELENFSVKIQNLEALLVARDQQLENDKENIAVLTETIANMESSMNGLSSELEAKSKIEKMQGETANEQAEHILKLEDREKILNQEIASLKESKAAYQDKVKANNASLLGQISDLEAELNTLREELNMKTKEVDSLNNSLSEMHTERNSILNDLKEKQIEFLNKDKIVEQYKFDISSFHSRLVELEAENGAIAKDVSEKSDEITLLKENIDSLVRDLKENQKVIEEKESVIRRHESNIHSIQSEIALVGAEKETVAKEVSEKNADIEALKRKLDDLEELKKTELLGAAEKLQEAASSRESNEEAIKHLQEKIAFLEQEKLLSNMSLSEKDTLQQEMLAEKLHLESLVEKLNDENILLKEQNKETVLLESSINDMIDLLDGELIGLNEFTVQLPESSKLKILAEKYISHLDKVKDDNQSLIDVNSKLKIDLENAMLFSDKQKQELETVNAQLEEHKKQCCELAGKLSAVENDLKLSNSNNCDLEQKLLDFQTEFEKLREEKSSIETNMNFSEKEFSQTILVLKDELAKSHLEFNESKECVQNYVLEKCELLKQCGSLEATIKEIESRGKHVQQEQNTLREKVDYYEGTTAKLCQQIKDSDEKEVHLLKEMKEKETTFLEEISSLNSVISDQKFLQNKTVSDLKEKIVQYEEEKRHLENIVSDLKTEILRKEQKITELESTSYNKDEELLKLQNQKLEETQKVEQSIETQIWCLQSFKQYSCEILKVLSNSMQINLDLSLFDCVELDKNLVEKFSKDSKNIIDFINQNSAKIQSQNISFNEMEKELGLFKSENSNLLTQFNEINNSLLSLANTCKEQLKENESKFELLSRACVVKNNTLEKVNCEILSLKEVYSSTKNMLNLLKEERDHTVKELHTLKDSLSKHEEVVKNITEDKEKLVNENGVMVRHREEQISQLNEQLQPISEKYGTLQDFCKAKQIDIDNLKSENGNLRNNFVELNSLEDLCNMKEREINSLRAETTHLRDTILSKDNSITQLEREMENNENSITTLRSELAESCERITSLQEENQLLNRQIQNCVLEPSALEASNNISNESFEEVTQLKREIDVLREGNRCLEEHITNSNLQMDSIMEEKVMLETNFEQMQHMLNETTEIKLQLSEELENNHLLLRSKEEEIRSLKEELADLEQARALLQSNENSSLINKINSLLEDYTILQNVVMKVRDMISITGSSDIDLEQAISKLNDEYLVKVFLEIQHSFKDILKNYAEENKTLHNRLETMGIQMNDLMNELDKSKRYQSENVNKSFSEQIVTSSHHDVNQSRIVELQQASAPLAESSEASIDSEIHSKLKEEINEYKIKFAKALSKLKLFKDKNEKLSEELQKSKDTNASLEMDNSNNLQIQNDMKNRLKSLTDANGKLSFELKNISLKTQKELDDLKNTISQLKEHNSFVDGERCKLQMELGEYRSTWEQMSVSYELQKEDNARLGEKYKEASQQHEELKSNLSELNQQLAQLKSENSRLRQECENSKEHAEMLISDNDTYQDLIEKLTASKHALEQKLSETRHQSASELRALQDQHVLEMKKMSSEPDDTTDGIHQLKELRNECLSLKSLYDNAQQQCDALNKERDGFLRNQSLFEREKIYLQQQLVEKVEELQAAKSKLDDLINNRVIFSTPALNVPDAETENSMMDYSKNQFNYILAENEELKRKLDGLTQELVSTREKHIFLSSASSEKEHFDREKIEKVELQRNPDQHVFVPSAVDSAPLERELQLAMASLHNQGLRCEELSFEVSKLLEERNMLKWKLQQYELSNSELSREDSLISTPKPGTVSINMEIPQSTSDIASLHTRLAESEKTCQQLRQANEALGRALISERDQKRLIEEELDFAKEHISEEAKAADEYQILLGEVGEPEFLAETNFAIRRNVRSHARKVRRWLRGRRNYLWRAVKSRNYTQLAYIFYMCLIHVWLLTCVLS